MIKIEHLMILFSTVLLAVLITTSYTTDITSATSDVTLRDRGFTDAAVEGALDNIVNDFDNTTNINIWNDERMLQAENDVLTALELNIGYHIDDGKDILKDNLPFIMFLDNDGFYIRYYEFNSNNDGTTGLSAITTPKMGYSEIKEGYLLEYSLKDVIRVTDLANGIVHSGGYEQVGNAINNPDWYVNMITNKSSLEKRIQNIMLDRLEENMNIYANYNNMTAQSKGKSYVITLDRHNTSDSVVAIEGGVESYNIVTDLQKMISEPGIVVFYQSNVVSNTEDRASVYTMASRQITTQNNYYITVDNAGYLNYHLPSCNHVNGAESQIYVDKVNSIENAAKKGAFACPDCNP